MIEHINTLRTILRRLSPYGWSDWWDALGLDLDADDEHFIAQLGTKRVVSAEWTVVGDFCERAARPIEPGDPTRSLLFHLLASPLVDVDRHGTALTEFPTHIELDAVENAVFARAQRSLDDVVAEAAERAGIPPAEVRLAVVPFASEYRNAPDTIHGRSADLCFARTGVARVGTEPESWDGRHRTFTPFVEGQDDASVFRVVPCRWSVYLAVLVPGDPDRFGPLARLSTRHGPESDRLRRFWVPVHKLFNGTECLQGMDLALGVEARHFNRKLEKLERRLRQTGHSNLDDATLTGPGYRVGQGLAAVSPPTGPIVVRPVPGSMVEVATSDAAPLSFEVPAMQQAYSDAFRPSLTLNGGRAGARPWPEYAHIRTEVRGGSLVDLEDDPVIASDLPTFLEFTSRGGGYRAAHYRDRSGDGFIMVSVRDGERALDLEQIPGFSLLAAPDFYPGVNQYALMSWWRSVADDDRGVPAYIREIVTAPAWRNLWRASPDALCDVRAAPNVELPGAPFELADETVTAVVAMPRLLSSLGPPARPVTSPNRGSTLPDAASGVFAPGWDVSFDVRTEGSRDRALLTSHGLGSPFPEDAKLCAALSTFWPAAAPDSTRNFVDLDPDDDQLVVDFSLGTIAPMTDQELGSDGQTSPWDGSRGPHVVAGNEERLMVSYPVFSRADYTAAARDGQMSMAQTQRVGFAEYTERILAMARAYRARGWQDQRQRVMVFSFVPVGPQDPELIELGRELTLAWLRTEGIYRVRMFHVQDVVDHHLEDSGRRAHISVSRVTTVVLGRGRGVLMREDIGDGSRFPGAWSVVD